MFIADKALDYVNSSFIPLDSFNFNFDCVKHNRTGRIYSAIQIHDAVNKITSCRYGNISETLYYAHVIEYIVDNFSQLSSQYIPCLTAVYRQLKCPHTAIFFFLYYFEEYEDEILTPELLTSVSAAFKDLALRYEIGSPKHLRYEKYYEMFLKCSEDLASTIKHTDYRLNLQYSYEYQKSRKTP